MDTIEISIDIQRPVEAVFAFVADQRHNPEWIGIIKEVQVTPDGPPTIGTQVQARVSFLGVHLEATTQTDHDARAQPCLRLQGQLRPGHDRGDVSL